MLRLPVGLGFDRWFGASTQERRRRTRAFRSEFARRGEVLEDRALLSTVTVHVENDAFSPQSVTINPGDTIHWVWDEGTHSTTSVAGSVESWNSDLNSAPFTFDHTFTHTGTFNYYCMMHGFDNGNGTASGMAGSIVVKTASPLKAIGVSPANPAVSAGGTQQFTATGVFADSSTSDLTSQVTWASSNPAVATIASSGKANAQAKGATVITAKLNGFTGFTVLTVNQAAPPSFTGEQRLTTGKGRHLKVTGFQLNFSGPLNGSVAQDTSHYHVVQPGRSRKLPQANVAVVAATYNPTSHSITLALGKFNAKKPLTLTATGLLGSTGTPAATIVTKL